MKPTLGQMLALSLLGLGATLGLLFYIVFDASRATVIESGERIRDGASQEIERRVTEFLAKAPQTVRYFQLGLQRSPAGGHPAEFEAALAVPLLANDDIGELTFTYGEKVGVDADGDIQLAAQPRGQWSVWRVADGPGPARVWSRHIHQEGAAFVADQHELTNAGSLGEPPLRRDPNLAIPDPTTHPTFTSPANDSFKSQLLWSDLHWSQLDADLPEAKRRIEVSVQEALTDSAGKFLGVLRVGLLTQQLDRVAQVRMTAAGSEDPHRIFICDARGRLITQGRNTDRWQDSDGDLRIAPDTIPDPIASALADPRLRAVNADTPSITGRFRHGGEEFLTTFRMLPETREWVVGIVVPRAFYLGKLTAMRNRLLVISLGIIVLLVTGGSIILRAVKRGQAQIVKESLKMNAFEFSAAPTVSMFRDVSDVLESLEKAKTAMRAMGKYAPLDLVRRLYREKSEPVLGGEPHELSIMFTDIKDFTTLSERLAPNDLAAALGRYLEVMAGIIQQECHGTIDKYVGDAIMTIWNAPEPVADHARWACLAALRCRDAGRALAGSPEWHDWPPFETRFGLHRDTALVGHFGAPDRMNYTAIGDAVNLASRLEGLNKSYGTTIIVSERIVEETGEHFDFRLLDWVAVKGKNEAVKIYELLGKKDEARGKAEVVAAYERAFAAYAAREFSTAIGLLAAVVDDPPSAHLLERCRGYEAQAPPPEWQGIHRAITK